MKIVTVLNHEGTTCLLPKPRTSNGAAYPFAFDAVAPESASWAYRVLPSRDPSHLTSEKLVALFKGPERVLRAVWEEQVGHRIGVLTIYREARNGTSSGFQAQYEKGPDMGMDKPAPSDDKAPKPDPEPEPIKHGPEMDMF